MAKRKREEVILAVRVELPTGANAKTATDFLRWAIEYGKGESSGVNAPEGADKLHDTEFFVKLQKRITDYV